MIESPDTGLTFYGDQTGQDGDLFPRGATSQRCHCIFFANMVRRPFEMISVRIVTATGEYLFPQKLLNLVS